MGDDVRSARPPPSASGVAVADAPDNGQLACSSSRTASATITPQPPAGSSCFLARPWPSADPLSPLVPLYSACQTGRHRSLSVVQSCANTSMPPPTIVTLLDADTGHNCPMQHAHCGCRKRSMGSESRPRPRETNHFLVQPQLSFHWRSPESYSLSNTAAIMAVPRSCQSCFILSPH